MFGKPRKGCALDKARHDKVQTVRPRSEAGTSVCSPKYLFAILVPLSKPRLLAVFDVSSRVLLFRSESPCSTLQYLAVPCTYLM